MKIAVSACLLGENCKYNGRNNYNSELVEFLREHEVVAICPEVLGGLPTPREPSEIVDGIVRQKDGTSVDKEFRFGARKALEKVLQENCELVILQSRSPSCGVNEIYDGTFSKKLISGDGIFVRLLREHKIPAIDVEKFKLYQISEEKK